MCRNTYEFWQKYHRRHRPEFVSADHCDRDSCPRNNPVLSQNFNCICANCKNCTTRFLSMSCLCLIETLTLDDGECMLFEFVADRGIVWYFSSSFSLFSVSENVYVSMLLRYVLIWVLHHNSFLPMSVLVLDFSMDRRREQNDTNNSSCGVRYYNQEKIARHRRTREGSLRRYPEN